MRNWVPTLQCREGDKHFLVGPFASYEAGRKWAAECYRGMTPGDVPGMPRAWSVVYLTSEDLDLQPLPMILPVIAAMHGFTEGSAHV